MDRSPRTFEPASADALFAEALGSIRRMTPTEALDDMLTHQAILIDTRCGEDRLAEGVVPGSIHIPRTVLEWRADRASRNRDERLLTGARLIVMCSDGYSSALAAANLVRLGHRNAADVVGGFRAWKAAGLPVEH